MKVWDKIEDHWALREDKTRFGKIQETFAKISDGSPPEVFHVHFEPEENLAALLNAPTTSFTRIIERKPGKTAEDLEGTLKAIARLLLPSDNLKSTYGGAWGKLVERDEHVLMAGWGSKDVSRRRTSSLTAVRRCVLNRLRIGSYGLREELRSR